MSHSPLRAAMYQAIQDDPLDLVIYLVLADNLRDEDEDQHSAEITRLTRVAERVQHFLAFMAEYYPTKPKLEMVDRTILSGIGQDDRGNAWYFSRSGFSRCFSSSKYQRSPTHCFLVRQRPEDNFLRWLPTWSIGYMLGYPHGQQNIPFDELLTFLQTYSTHRLHEFDLCIDDDTATLNKNSICLNWLPDQRRFICPELTETRMFLRELLKAGKLFAEDVRDFKRLIGTTT